LRKIVWQEHLRCTEELPRPTPILACLNDSAWDRHWKDKPARVRACKQVRVDGQQEELIMATCDTPGMVTITSNARLGRHKSMAVARGLAIVKPDEPFLVKLCNFGKDQVIVRRNQGLRNNDSDKAPFCKQRPPARSNIFFSSVFPRRAGA